MKRFVALLLVLMITACLFSACDTGKEPEPQKNPETKYGMTFYVAINGSDENDGTKESPLATLGGAAAKIHEFKTANGLPEGGIKVEFAAGTYKVTKQTELTSEDSGEDGKPIVYAAADGAEVIFDGGISLNPADFKPANDDFKAKLVSDEAKQNVLEIDLAAAGIWDADDSENYTPGMRADRYRQSLYVNNRLQTVARWPNGEYYKAVFSDDAPEGTAIMFPEEKARLWANETNIRAYGYPVFDWESSFFFNLSLKAGTSLLDLGKSFNKGQTVFVFNIPCELDEPGEYYWDTEENKLYYWPENGFETSKIVFSQFSEAVICLENAEHLTFDGFTFENLRYKAINGSSDYLTVCDCIFRCIAAYAVDVSGLHNTVKNSEFCDLGGGAVYMRGGDIAKQICAENRITDNIIRDWSQVYTVYNAGIKTEGMGFVVSHNELYNSPHEAITIGSGNSVIEYNEVRDVCTETVDAGGITVGSRWDWGNTVFRYNYVHDITHANAFYLDDAVAKITCYGNIVLNAGGNAFKVGGGRNISIYNNVMVNSGNIFLDGRGFKWYPTVTSYPDGTLWKNNTVVNYLTALWKYMQPEYQSVLEMRTTEELDALKGITSDMLDSPGPQSYDAFYNNIVYFGDYTPSADTSVYGIDDTAYAFAHIENYTEYADNPKDVFVDPDNGNFFLKDDSRVYRDVIGFEKWDYSLIGPRK